MNIRSILKKMYLSIYHLGLLNFIPDEVFIPFQYRVATGKYLDLSNVKTFNEKIQWIKLYDRNPIYPLIVDKYKVREYVSEKIGAQYLIPLLGKWDRVDDVNLQSLPDQFVIKCNHDSGGIAICRNKNSFDWYKEKLSIQKHLEQNHYYMSREWAYKDVKPCIIAEQYIMDEETRDLRDYKFFCFNGRAKYVQVDFDRFVDHKRNIYDMNWNLVDLTIKCPNDPHRILKKPNDFDEMIRLAEKLSEGFPQIRVDLYYANKKIYFGELTLYHGNGFEKFTPEYYGEIFGSFIDLG